MLTPLFVSPFQNRTPRGSDYRPARQVYETPHGWSKRIYAVPSRAATTCNMSVRFYTKLAFFGIVASRVVRPLAFLQKAVRSKQCGLLSAWYGPSIHHIHSHVQWVTVDAKGRLCQQSNEYTGTFQVHMAITFVSLQI